MGEDRQMEIGESKSKQRLGSKIDRSAPNRRGSRGNRQINSSRKRVLPPSSDARTDQPALASAYSYMGKSLRRKRLRAVKLAKVSQRLGETS